MSETAIWWSGFATGIGIGLAIGLGVALWRQWAAYNDKRRERSDARV